MAGKHMPDLILLDLQMPVMGGFAVIRELRKTPELSKLKVIAVTSFAMKGDREKALEAGFDEYVTKPIDTRKFVEIVKNILPSENMTLKKPIILCVDDGPANLKLLENILVPRGYEVVSAANGEDALLKIKTRTIDLVLLDLMLPGMDGLQVSRKIKDNKKYRNIPIIMLTAYSGVESYIKSLSGEVFAYLHKPFEAEELVGIVRAALGQLEAGPGNNDAQVKFQISMKFRVLEPNLYVLKYNLFPAYVAYTQKSLWNVGQQSMPVEESNYNPEFFLDYPVNAVIIGRFKLRNMVISPIEHESNGLAGVQSRGWNRQYVLIKFGLESKEKLEVTNSFLSDKGVIVCQSLVCMGLFRPGCLSSIYRQQR